MSRFEEQYHGRLTAAMGWNHFDALWERLRRRAQEGWYVYTIGGPVPREPLSAEAFAGTLDQLAQRLRQDHQEDYCGIVYADDLQAPEFVKVYDPGNLGKVCGFSEEPIPPGWVISREPPVDVAQLMAPKKAQRRPWWRFW